MGGSYGTSECIAPSGSTADPTQICSISSAPLSVLASARADGGSFASMETALRDAGYPIFSVDDSNMQYELSACATQNGVWKIAAVSDFSSVCGGSSPPPSPSPPPAPSTYYGGAYAYSYSSPVGECVPNQHGPACSSNSDCDGVIGCVRCAGSGYCTDVPLDNLVV